MEDRNKLFAELAGIHWHEWSDDGGRHYSEWRSYSCDCGATTESPTEPKGGPDFTDAREVLVVMWNREDWQQFVRSMDILYYPPNEGFIEPDCVLIPVRIVLDTTGLLRDEAIEFLEGRK